MKLIELKGGQYILPSCIKGVTCRFRLAAGESAAIEYWLLNLGENGSYNASEFTRQEITALLAEADISL